MTSFEEDKTPPLFRETMVEIEKPPSPPPSSSVIAKIFPPIDPPPLPKSSRTREWLVDYKFLPSTIEGLRASFEELIKNIANPAGMKKPGIETKPCSC